MNKVENVLKSKTVIYDFELFFLNNIYDCIETVNVDLEYLIDSYDEFREKIYSDFRTVIINLATAFELLVKFRLEDEHWSLMFSDINKAEKSKLENGNFISVDIETGVLRLKRICGLDYNFKNLRKICNYRNCLVHYTLKSANIIEIIDTISKGILEIKKFFENDIYKLLPEEAKKDFKGVLRQLEVNCENLTVLNMKICKQGSGSNE